MELLEYRWCKQIIVGASVLLALQCYGSSGNLKEDSTRIASALDKGMTLFGKSDFAGALVSFQMARKSAEKSDDLRSIALAQKWIGNAYFRLSEYPKAEAAYKAANSLADTQLVYEISLNLGGLSVTLERYTQAISPLRGALAYFNSINDTDIAIAASNNLGAAYMYVFKLDSAIQFIESALELSVIAGDTFRMAECRQNLGVFHYTTGEYYIAQEHFETALAEFRSIGLILETQPIFKDLVRIYTLTAQKQNLTKALREHDQYFKTVPEEWATYFKAGRELIKDEETSDPHIRGRIGWIAVACCSLLLLIYNVITSRNRQARLVEFYEHKRHKLEHSKETGWMTTPDADISEDFKASIKQALAPLVQRNAKDRTRVLHAMYHFSKTPKKTDVASLVGVSASTITGYTTTIEKTLNIANVREFAIKLGIQQLNLEEFEALLGISELPEP